MPAPTEQTAAPAEGPRDTRLAAVRPGRRSASRAGAFYQLTKPGIAGFAMVTAGVAFYVASGGTADFLPVFHTLLGTVLATAGALALNQYSERRVDALMIRTRGRPLPSGRLRPWEALAFGLVLVAAGVGHLWFWVGWLPAALTLFSAVAYLLVYTPLKTRSYLATLAGAIPGSMPALIGWSAATGTVTLPAAVFFGTMFIWQLPHVVALAWLLREDYARAGFFMIPPVEADGGDRWTGRQLLLHSVLLIPMSLALTPLGVLGWVYFWGALFLGSVLFWWSAVAFRQMDREIARKIFLGSLAYHPLLLTLMLLDTVR